MKYSREYILRRAFDVFMDKGYDSASISVLQTELSMSRGAMYRYFKNKEELFISVIDEYFFKIFERLIKNIDTNQTVSSLIKALHRRQRLIITAFSDAGVNESFFLNYTALIIQAAKHYPDFIKRYIVINRRMLNNWKMALENSIEINEVRSDVNIPILCNLFNNVSVRESSDQELDRILFSEKIFKDMEKRKQIMDYLFSLIKV